MNIKKHLDKDNLHHAYLIEGAHVEILPEVLSFIESLGIKIENNIDISQIFLDSFKIDDARNLKSFSNERGFSGGKKIFIISANSFLLEAQNTLLKIFEEPIENTYFFIIVPDRYTLLPTFVSRFYFISAKPEEASGSGDAIKFLKMPLASRLNFIKDLLAEKDDEEMNSMDSNRNKALKFLNALEQALHQSLMSKANPDIDTTVFEHIFKAREVLRMPGSAIKTLLESIALIVPDFKN